MKTFFQKILDFIKNEPAAFGGAVTALVQAIIGFVVAFNLDITPEQQNAILGLTTALVSMTVLVAAVIRQNVTPIYNPKDNSGNPLIPKEG